VASVNKWAGRGRTTGVQKGEKGHGDIKGKNSLLNRKQGGARECNAKVKKNTNGIMGKKDFWRYPEEDVSKGGGGGGAGEKIEKKKGGGDFRPSGEGKD